MSARTREEWLQALARRMGTTFAEAGSPIPPNLRVSCGWPSVGALRRKDRRIGECWSPDASADGYHEVFVSPAISDSLSAGAILTHELCHAAVGTKHWHKAPFRRVALAVGLEGKMTATVASDHLKAHLTALMSDLGPYPHSALDQSTRRKQGTRMLKASCACGYVIRLTRKWAQTGLPTCICGERFTLDGEDSESGDGLNATPSLEVPSCQ